MLQQLLHLMLLLSSQRALQLTLLVPQLHVPTTLLTTQLTDVIYTRMPQT